MRNRTFLPKKYAEATLKEYFKLSNISELSDVHLPIPVKDIADSHYRIYVGRSDCLVEKLPHPIQKRLSNKPLSGLLLVGPRIKEIWVAAAEAERSRRRERFTIAHELGHYLIHSDKSTLSQLFFACRDKDIYSPIIGRGKHGREFEANRFAAELLMPNQLVKQLVRQCKASIAKMAMNFDVSTEAMGIRLAQLRLMPKF